MDHAASSSGQHSTGESPAARKRRFKYSPVGFLVALVLLIVTIPAVEDIEHGDLIEAILLTLVLVSAVLALGARRRTFFQAALLVTPALAGKWINHLWPERLPPVVFLSAAMLFLIFVVAHLLHFILHAPRVDAGVICAAISTYLVLGFLWAIAYGMVAKVTPEAFAYNTGPKDSHIMMGGTAFYFSFITLCTLGYGDIVPVSKVARMLAVTEAITGVFYVAILMARLVTLYSSPRHSGHHEATK